MALDFRVFDSLSDGVQVIGEDWTYRYLNDVVVRQSQQSREALLGRTMMEMYPGIEDTKMFAALAECMASREPVRTINDFTFPDGSKQYFQLRAEPLSDGSIIVFSTDVTEEQVRLVLMENMGAELEALVEERTAQLLLKNRELEQFTSVASHDLKSPLRSIHLFASLLEEECSEALGEEGRDYLSQVLRGTRRMKMIIDALLRHAQIGSARRSASVDVGALVDDVVADLSALVEESSAAVVHAGLPTVAAYPTDLQLLFQNLIVNAIKYRREDVAPRIEIAAEEGEDGWQFAVRDNGIGIAPEHHQRVFDLFHRLHSKDAIAGVGLGLAHCEKIVGLHGGRIWVDSIPGQGSTFAFTLREPVALRAPA